MYKENAKRPKNGDFQILIQNDLQDKVGQGGSKMAIFKNHFSHDIFIQLSLLLSKMTILALL